MPDAVAAPLFAESGFFLAAGQGAGQVRDAACPCGGRAQRDRGGGRARLLAGRVLSGRSAAFERAGMAGLLDEQARAGGDRSSSPRRSWRSWPGRRRGAVGRASWPRQVEAPVRGGAAPAHGGAGPAVSTPAPVRAQRCSGRSARPRRPTTRRCARTCWPPATLPDSMTRGPVRPPRAGRADRLAEPPNRSSRPSWSAPPGRRGAPRRSPAGARSPQGSRCCSCGRPEPVPTGTAHGGGR